MSNHTLKMAELSAESTTKYKEYTLNQYNILSDVDRDDDSFAQLKRNLCDAVEQTKGFWDETHSDLYQYIDEVQEMIDYKGCRRIKDKLIKVHTEVSIRVGNSERTLQNFIGFYNYNIDYDLNCKL